MNLASWIESHLVVGERPDRGPILPDVHRQYVRDMAAAGVVGPAVLSIGEFETELRSRFTLAPDPQEGGYYAVLGRRLVGD